jgi:hypothetical protein
MLTPQILLGCFALAFTTGAAGVAGAWLLRRRTMLRLQNLNAPAALGIVLLAVALAGAVLARGAGGDGARRAVAGRGGRRPALADG